MQASPPFQAGMRYLCFLFALLSCFFFPLISAAQNTKLIVNTGTTLKVSGNNLVLQNTDLQCNGTLDASAAALLIIGPNNSSISGAGSKTVQTFTLNTSSSTTLSMLGALTIMGALNFQNGLIDLTSQQITLTPTGSLQGESESSRTITSSTGSVTTTRTGITAPSQYNAGNLGASITSAANLGNLTITRFNKPGVNPGSPGLQGIQRVYFIQPQNNTALNATLRIYYLNAELNGNSASTLTFWKSSDGITWNQLAPDVRNTVSKYVEKSGITDFSYWTLSGSNNPLPLTLLSFRVTCDNDFSLVQWSTGTENSVDHFELERSDNGSSWKLIRQITASNNTNGNTYLIKDPDRKATAFYRLKIVEWSGSFSYSPVFRGGCSELPMPFAVYPNPVTDQATARVSVRQTVNATMLLYDMNGKLLFSNQWQLLPGLNQFPLHLAQLSAGRYIVKLVLPGRTEEAHIVKQ